MIITRIYTGDDGQSHMEDFDLADHSNAESLQAVTSVVFRSHEPGRFSDWHCESRRNYIITVSGEGEIGLGDGSTHRIGPGRVMLVEDLTGSRPHDAGYQQRAESNRRHSFGRSNPDCADQAMTGLVLGILDVGVAKRCARAMFLIT